MANDFSGKSLLEGSTGIQAAPKRSTFLSYCLVTTGIIGERSVNLFHNAAGIDIATANCPGVGWLLR